jgi:two-component system response regulator AtoC
VEEIPVLADYFLRQYSRKYRREVPSISDQLMRGFLAYAWPGNVRELENMVKRIVVLQSEDPIAEEIFGATRSLSSLGSPKSSASSLERMVDQEIEEGGEKIALREIGRRAAREAEREALQRVLYQTNWNRKKAAKILEVSYKTLLQKIKECGLAD